MCYLKPLTVAISVDVPLTHNAWCLQDLSLREKSTFLQTSVAGLIIAQNFLQLSSNLGCRELSQFHQGLLRELLQECCE